MSVVVVRYRTRPERAEENQQLVEEVFAELAASQPDGLRYATFRLADGEQFVHVAEVDTADGANPLAGVAAFARVPAGDPRADGRGPNGGRRDARRLLRLRVRRVSGAGHGTAEAPWVLTTPPGGSEYTAYRDEAADPPALVVQVGTTQLRYHLRCIDDLHAMLVAAGDWVPLGNADERKPAAEGTVEAWGRAADNPVGGWYGLKKGLRGRFANYVPPVLERLGLAEVEHQARNNRMRARRDPRRAGCGVAVKQPKGDPFEALGDPNRRAIVERLSGGASSVGALAEALPISRPAVSRHLRLLKEAGLVVEEPVGTRRVYRLHEDGVAAVQEYLTQVWGDAIARFTITAENTRPTQPASKPPPSTGKPQSRKPSSR